MKCVDKLRAKVESIGASFSISDDETTMYADAKPGYIWDAYGCSVISIQADNSHGQSWWVKACKDMEEEASLGMSKCSPEDSERIAFERDEPWTAKAEDLEHINWPT